MSKIYRTVNCTEGTTPWNCASCTFMSECKSGCSIILTSEITPSCDFSVECGMADSVRHFDHHGEHGAENAPCNDVTLSERDVVYGEINISHIDADTYVGLLRLCKRVLPTKVDFSLMEKIDLNGSSVCSDLYDPTLLYMVGIGAYAREIKFPRVGEPQDVTSFIKKMFEKDEDFFIALGKKSTHESEKAYKDCNVTVKDNVGLWSIDASDALDPSRPYGDGVDVVVVYRKHYKSISIYCNPASSHEFAGKTVGGVSFAGHPKACGSPRGIEMSVEDAKKVFNELSE